MQYAQATRVMAVANHFLQARWRFQHLRGQALTHFQDRRARAIVRSAYRNSPFYRMHWAGHDMEQWQTLPIVDKQLMLRNFGTANTVGLGYEDALRMALEAEQSGDFRPRVQGLTVGLSSGTSRQRGLFVVNSAEASAWATTILARMLHRFQLRGYRVALFLRSNSHLYEHIGRGVVQFRYFDLQHPLDDSITRLNAYRPTIVVGPPSLLILLAATRAAGRLRIAPQMLISAAEILDPHDRHRLTAQFGVPVHEIYQCTEGLIALSCRTGRLHIQEDIVALQTEPLPGTTGTHIIPIITDLWRTAQPMIRYRLDDVLELDSEPCPCGSAFRVIRAVAGRYDDLCYFPTASGERVPLFPNNIGHMLMHASDQILDYQVFQSHVGQLQIYLDVVAETDFPTLASMVRRQVEATLASSGLHVLQLQVAPAIPALRPGIKRRRVQRQEPGDLCA